MRVEILAKADKGTLTWEMLAGGKIRITSNSLTSGDTTILPGEQLAVRIGNTGQVYESDRPRLVRHVIPGGFGPPMQQRVTGPDDIDDPDGDSVTIANVTMSPSAGA